MADISKQRKFIAKDFDSFRTLLLTYARTYFGDKISDFSDASVGGMFLDLSSYVGDVLSFYLDHQFNELDINTAIENDNIERILRNSGLKISGATPATVNCTFNLKVPAKNINNNIIPDPDALPIIRAGTTLSSNTGVDFVLLEDIDFSSNFSQFAGTISGGIPINFIISKSGICRSGKIATETFSLEEFIPFRKITLANTNVSEIVSVTDSNGNIYYEVSSLTDDTVFRNEANISEDSGLVREVIEVINAAYRFTTESDLLTRSTTLTFGGGSAKNFEDDIIPDPADYAISFPNKKTFTKSLLNPNNLVNSKTLGIADENIILTIEYHFGGGLNHNVGPRTITNIRNLIIFFPNQVSQTIKNSVRSSTEVINNDYAKGGEDAPDINTLRSFIPQVINSQNRIVSKEDLIARLYTMPSNFGRIFRAGISKNKNFQENFIDLFIISRNSDNTLIKSPDTLKTNIIKYLEPYRLISDFIRINDAKIINIKVIFDVLIDKKFRPEVIKQNCISEIIKFFDIKKSSINKSINISELRKNIFDLQGVITINNLSILNLSNQVSGRTYSNEAFQIDDFKFGDLIYPPDGGIFEIKFIEFDIEGIVR